MDASGRIAAHTGTECVDWCGHVEGEGFSVAGNMLAGPAVIDETAKAYVANAGAAVCAPPDRGAEGGRGGRRRQARQAVGGAADLRRGGVARPRPARRRPRRSARRAGAARAGQPRALGAFREIPADAQESGRGHRSRRHRRRHPGSHREPVVTHAAARDRGPARRLPRRPRPPHPRGRRRRSHGRARRDARHRRRIRLRQERHLARRDGPAAEALRGSDRHGPLRRFRSARSARRDAARPARRPARDDLPGADDVAQSELHHRRADHRGAGAPSRRLAAAGARARHRAAAPRPTFPRRTSASTTIRTSSPAACASAS